MNMIVNIKRQRELVNLLISARNKKLTTAPAKYLLDRGGRKLLELQK